MYRSRVILIKNKHIALIHRQREGREYYVFPGGGAEVGETPTQTAIRESREELGVTVSIEKLIATVTSHSIPQYYYLVRLRGGKFGAGTGPEMIGRYPPERGTYRPVWVALEQIPQLPVFPAEIAAYICQAASQDWDTTPLKIEISP